MVKIDLIEIKNKDVRTIDRDSIIDDSEIVINESLPKIKRIIDYLSKSGNPYFSKSGKYIVKNSYTDTTVTMQEIIQKFSSK